LLPRLRLGSGRQSITEFIEIVASRIKTINFALATAFLVLAANTAPADGVSAYLPLNLEPEIERQIERVLILADEPVLKRPFAVALVELALPQACKRDQALCVKVKKYLERYSRDYAVTHASATGALTRGAQGVVPNQYGLPMKSDWEISALGYVQPSDYFLASGGVISYSGRTQLNGTMLSLGFNWAQLDVGFRDHWLSPATDSSMLVSTESPTPLSATLSNYEPLTRLGFQYELFLMRLSQTGSNRGDSLPGDNISYNGVSSRGNPRVFGTQLSIEPFPGWSLGINRILEYGGGSGLPTSARFLLRDFFQPGGLSQTQGNQQASYVSRFIFPGKTPFAVYFQYAGEDNSNGGSYLLGNAALSAGIDFPRIWHHFDMTYEVSEWQNIWYVHNIFLDGMTNDGLVLGNWGADQRRFGDGVGARSQMLRIGWEPPFGGYLEERVRTVANENYYGGDLRQFFPGEPAAYPYHHYYDLSVRYSRPWNDLTVGGEVLAGRDVFGKSFSRLSGFVRYGGDRRTRDDGTSDDDPADTGYEHGSELFVDAGANANRVRSDLQKGLPITTSKVMFGPHFALGARREVSNRNDWGVRLEMDEIDGHSLIGVRPVDYRHRYGDTFALNLYAGVDRYNLATPAYSLYGGIGGQWRNVVPKWDLGLDFRYAQNIARDHVYATDPVGARPDSFYKIQSVIGYVSRRF
jgi:Capsule assembly protein Wzi